MDRESILKSINLAISEIHSYLIKYDLGTENSLSTHSIKVLELLKREVENNEIINERVLRGFKDICTTISIHFEYTNFSNPILEIYNELERSIPKFKNLELLRMDFGKGDPV